MVGVEQTDLDVSGLVNAIYDLDGTDESFERLEACSLVVRVRRKFPRSATVRAEAFERLRYERGVRVKGNALDVCGLMVYRGGR